MTYLEAFFHQFVIFLMFITMLSYNAYKRGDKDFSNFFPPEWHNPPYFWVYLVFLWFVLLTYFRVAFDIPRYGIWSYLILPSGNVTTQEMTRRTILFIVVLGYLMIKLIFFYDTDNFIKKIWLWIKNKVNFLRGKQ